MLRLVALVATLLAASVQAFVPTAGLASSMARASTRTAVEMKSGSQVSFRIRKKRMENQEKGRLRLNVYRSNKHIYAQVIDDDEMATMASASTNDPGLREALGGKVSDCKAATEVGKLLGERCKSKSIEKLFFDRASGSHQYKYHGRVKSLVEGVRESGVVV